MMHTADFAPYELMSPTLLARQPPTSKPERVKDNPDWDTIYAHCEQRVGALRTWRWSWWTFWAVLAAFFLPFRYVWLVTANKMWRGGNLNQQILNSHGLLAVRTCAAGMWTGFCSPSRPWFKYGAQETWEDLDEEAKSWLQDTEQKTYTVLEASNFYSTMAQAFRDETVFGQAPLIIYEDVEDIVRFYGPAAGEYYLGKGARLSNDTLAREFAYTVLQIVEMFQLENCPGSIQEAWKAGSYEQEFVVCHLIEPNFDLNRRGGVAGKVKVVPSKFTWREVYWLKGTKTNAALSIKGFNDKPFVVPGWMTVSNDAYFRSPCMDAIGDNKQLQTEDLRKAEFIEKGVRPPMGAHPTLKEAPASIMPSQITYMATKESFWPLFEVRSDWVSVLTADTAKLEARIDHCLYVDLFMAISRMEGVQPRNELELTKRDLERLQELGPVIELAEREFDVLIHRVLAILERRGMLKPMPASLQGTPLKVSYVSILKLAQRSAESVAMKDVFVTGGQLSSAAKAAGVPDPLRIINLDKAYRRYAEINNLDPDLLYTDGEVKQHDAIRAKAMQQAQTPQNAMAAVTAAKTLSETQLGGNSALGAMLGPQAGGAPPQ